MKTHFSSVTPLLNRWPAKFCAAAITSLLTTASFGQGVGINTTTPDPSAALDIQATDKGLLIPRVSLQSVSDNMTVPNPATGLLVYNTNADYGDGIGFYYNINTSMAPDWRSVADLRLPLNKSTSLPSGATAFRLNDFGSSGSATTIHAFSQNGYALLTEGKVRIAGSSQNPGTGKVLTSDGSGNATWEGGVAFRVFGTPQNDLAPNVVHKVPFLIEEYDTKNGYSLHGFPNEDSFTVPNSGIYHFDFLLNWSAGSTTASLMVEGDGGGTREIASYIGNESVIGCSVDTRLTAGEKVFVQLQSGTAVQLFTGYFNGHMIMATK